MSLNYPLYPSWYPQLYSPSSWQSNSAVVAPFWTDIDLSNTDGVVYLGHFSRSYAEEPVTSQAAEVFEEVRLLVLFGAGDTGFLPTEVVTVTWHNVSPYPGYYYSSEVRAIDVVRPYCCNSPGNSPGAAAPGYLVVVLLEVYQNISCSHRTRRTISP